MSQTRSSVIKKFSTIFVIVILPICLSHPINVVNSFYKKTHPKTHHKHPQHHNKLYHLLERLSSTNKANFKRSESIYDQKYKTSCGKIICDNVKGYPSDTIERAFLEKYGKEVPHFLHESSEPVARVVNRFKNSEEVMETDIFNNVLKLEDSLQKNKPTKVSNDGDENETDIKMKLFSIPSTLSMNGFMRSIDDRYYGDRHSLRKSRPFNDILYSKTKNCEPKVEISYPQEAVNYEYKPVLLPQISNFTIKAYTCTAEKYCYDPTTPDDHVKKCETKIVEEPVLTFQNEGKTFTRQIVLVPKGCDCKLVRIEDVNDYFPK